MTRSVTSESSLPRPQGTGDFGCRVTHRFGYLFICVFVLLRSGALHGTSFLYPSELPLTVHYPTPSLPALIEYFCRRSPPTQRSSFIGTHLPLPSLLGVDPSPPSFTFSSLLTPPGFPVCQPTTLTPLPVHYPCFPLSLLSKSSPGGLDQSVLEGPIGSSDPS